MLHFVAVVGALLLGACQTTGTPQRGTELNPIATPRGAQHAIGAVLYLHGKDSRNVRHEAEQRSPPMLNSLQSAGFDVFRLDLSPGDQAVGVFPNRVVPPAIRRLREAGYRPVYLVGQSAGGWVALMEIGKDALAGADGAIAFAPALNGYAPIANQVTLHRLTLDHLTNGRRVAIFHFRNDHLLLNWHGDAVRLSQTALSGRPDAMVRVPDLILGHDAAGEQSFADRYGDCLARFLAADRADQSVCPP